MRVVSETLVRSSQLILSLLSTGSIFSPRFWYIPARGAAWIESATVIDSYLRVGCISWMLE